jgi:hypothetical protein
MIQLRFFILKDKSMGKIYVTMFKVTTSKNGTSGWEIKGPVDRRLLNV